MGAKQMDKFEYATLNDYLSVELEEAKLDLEIAYNQFNHCDPEFIDYCCLQIESAKAKISAILKNMKMEVSNNEQGSYSDSANKLSDFINRILRT